MASTNEDVVVLATAPLDNGRLLIIRHLPDRGTIEIGWWEREESGSIRAWAGSARAGSRSGRARRRRTLVRGVGWHKAGTQLAKAKSSPKPRSLPMAPASQPCIPGTG